MMIKIAPTESRDSLFANSFPSIEISIDGDDHDIDNVWGVLIRPALIAWGFTPETVDLLTDGGDDVSGK